ncbi:MAG: hypothetical protein KGL39_36545 [Patescibacteria group bacterium]|nr:hypothetical protein [Patescibacteria group bacterium]
MAKANNASTGGQPSAQQANMIARNAVLTQSIDMLQAISTQTLSGTIAGQVVNIPIRNVGLLKRLIVKLTFTVARSAAETQNRTSFGPANALSQVVFTDLANQTRINTSGWHLHYLASARRLMAYGAAFTNDTPTNIGSNYTVISAPANFTAGNQTITMYYEIPIAYGDYDLRGAIFMSVVNATANLQLTINPNFFVASTADGTLAVYKSTTTDLGTISACTVQVYQNYLDQLPYTNKGAVLPLLDLSTAYLINNTVATGMVANQDFAVPYANFRNFLSTFAIYDNNSALAAGTDINYWKLEAANYTNIFNVDPITNALMQRNIINDDFPAGMYYFDSRRKPISTIQYGNMQLVMNPSSVTSGQLLVGYEAWAIIDQITQAGSLYNT